MESQLYSIPPDFKPIHLHGKFSSTISTQLRTNLKRSGFSILRSREEVRARIMRNFILGILIGTTFLRLKTDQDGLLNRFAVFFTSVIVLASGATNLVHSLFTQRAVFYRERAAGTYSTMSYLIGTIVTDLPITLLTTLVYAVPLYWLVGLRPDAGSFFFFVWEYFIFTTLQSFLVYFITTVTPNEEIAQAMAGVSMTIFSLFGGFLITKPNIPDYWKWLYYISFMHYPLEAVLINEMDGLAFFCPNNNGAVPIPIAGQGVVKEYCPIPSGDVFLGVYSLEISDKFPDMGITLGMMGGMLVLCFLSLRFLSFLKR